MKSWIIRPFKELKLYKVSLLNLGERLLNKKLKRSFPAFWL
jgi:hypothetical protein